MDKKKKKTETADAVKTAVLLMNTGTADAPTEEAIGRYLREFLMDPAIIGAPYPIRYMLVSHISQIRPRRTVKKYQEIWTGKGFPFMLDSLAQGKALEEELSGRNMGRIAVYVAMRYGNPSIADTLTRMMEDGVQQVVLMPCYPQQVNVCAGTSLLECRRQMANLQKKGWKPECIEIPYFYDEPLYGEALAESVQRHWTYQPGSKLVVSFHSTMMRDIEAGDPYRDQTIVTAKQLASRLQVPEEDLIISYQSRFDNRKWLGPFTEPTIMGLAEQGVKDVCIVCPVFTVDNMETTLDISRDMRDAYRKAAGADSRFTYVPALGSDPKFMKALADRIVERLQYRHTAKIEGLRERTVDRSVPGMLKNAEAHSIKVGKRK